MKAGEIYRIPLEVERVHGGNIVFRLPGTEERFLLPVKAGGNDELVGQQVTEEEIRLRGWQK